MPIGLSFSPYSSRSTLLIQYQSPFLKSLTFIFSSDMATNNKGVIDHRPRLIPPITVLRHGGESKTPSTILWTWVELDRYCPSLCRNLVGLSDVPALGS